MSCPRTISKEWCDFLKEEFDKPYFLEIAKKYKIEKASNQKIFPPNDLIFNAFNLTPPCNIKIVILGQDPYHGSFIINGREIPQAMGLSFSVPKGLPLPPSLKNIYKEIESTLGIKMPNHGDLSEWSNRGVLLLNSIFSVRSGLASSHSNLGWEEFSDAVIKNISLKMDKIVFMLWGNFAKKKSILIDKNKHCVITAPHPSPLARGFVGSGVFLSANQALKNFGREEMDWSLK